METSLRSTLSWLARRASTRSHGSPWQQDSDLDWTRGPLQGTLTSCDSTRLEIRLNFFSVRVWENWNKLPDSAKQAPSTHAFKNRLDKGTQNLTWSENSTFQTFWSLFDTSPYLKSRFMEWTKSGCVLLDQAALELPDIEHYIVPKALWPWFD